MYNLNNVKEIKVTKEFLSLDKDTIGCQNFHSIDDCKTEEYINTLKQKCNCSPYSIMNFSNLTVNYNIHIYVHLIDAKLDTI